jgi:DNA repair protein RecN (Recombination protein N)
MLTEVRVAELGLFADLTLVLGPGLTALTGETGAGKTLVVDAIELLLGGRADPVLVRPGAEQASVEGRFVEAGEDGDDLILARTLPASGRSRAYVDGRMAPLTTLAEAAARLVDLHGQHAGQSLLSPAVQRAAVDRFGGIDHREVTAAKRAVRLADEALADLGGDVRMRAREIDLLRFQIGELDAAAIADPDEDLVLAGEEDRLSAFAAHQEAAAGAGHALTGDGGAADGLGMAISVLADRRPFSVIHDRLQAAAVELADAATELRDLAEDLQDDPERLGQIRARRQLLRELRRKYGDDLAEVIAFRDQAAARLDELESHEERVQQLERQRQAGLAALATAETAVGWARRAAAPKLAKAVEQRLRDLAMPRASFEVSVGADRAGDEITWLLGANPGEPALPLSKVASGGELSRTMLAVRLVLGQAVTSSTEDADRQEDRRTLIFDEVDAGIGGEAAVAVGRALADLARRQQVLVVTHLAQVAAFADQQIAVSKDEAGGRTVARATTLDVEGRVVELSRMLSGQPDSATARRHAKELLAFGSAQPAPRPSSTYRARAR